MRRTVIGFIAVIAASSVFTAAGLGMASAASALASDTPPGVTATTYSPIQEAANLRALHDALQSAAQARNVPGMNTVSGRLADELTKVAQSTLVQSARPGNVGMSPDGVTNLNKARQTNTSLGQQLTLAMHAKSGSDLGGGLLDTVLGLVSTLLKAVTALVGSLLAAAGGPPAPAPGGAPLPSPAPGGH